jgi:hypothetical protein
MRRAAMTDTRLSEAATATESVIGSEPASSGLCMVRYC